MVVFKIYLNYRPIFNIACLLISCFTNFLILEKVIIFLKIRKIIKCHYVHKNQPHLFINVFIFNDNHNSKTINSSVISSSNS